MSALNNAISLIKLSSLIINKIFPKLLKAISYNLYNIHLPPFIYTYIIVLPIGERRIIIILLWLTLRLDIKLLNRQGPDYLYFIKEAFFLLLIKSWLCFRLYLSR